MIARASRAVFVVTLSTAGGCSCSSPAELPDAQLDAAVLDAPGPGPDAPGLDAPGLDASGPDAPGVDASGLDAPRIDAHSDAALDADVRPGDCVGLGLFDGDLPCVDVPCGLRETLEIDPAHFRNDRPSIAVDGASTPTIAYTIAEGGYRAYLARREGAGFVSSLAGVAADVAIATGVDGCGYGFLNDGAFGSGLFRIEGSTFVPFATRDSLMVSGGRVILDASGVVHVVGYDETTFGGVRLSFDTALHEHPLSGVGGAAQLPASIAHRSDGTVETAFYAQTSDVYALYRQVGDAIPELVATGSGGAALFGPSVNLAIGGDGSTHILYEAGTGDVLLATRGALWELDSLFAGEPAAPCPPADVEGTTCSTTEVRYSALGLAAAMDGDALGVVSRTQIDVVSKVVCGGGIGPLPPGPPPPFCMYMEQSRAVQSSLHAVMIAGTTVTTREIAREGGGLVGTVALAPDGTMHVASYDATGAVRYAAIAAD
ncbi:MAG: hypothetical protein K1X94_03360 [Sandaracinaceae bacterium]|nr:hypothetical protein [Sandaracinaceae bacterium]